VTDAWRETVARLQELPARPRRVTGPANWLNVVTLVAEYATTVPVWVHRLTVPLRTYPAPFEKVRFRARDGTRLVGWLGRAAAEPRDAILLLPGLYTSKDNPRIRARAVRMLRGWGFHVLCLDLRAVGESERTYSTPGWKEAEDIADAIAFLKRHAPVRRVHLYAESLAASAALVAAGLEAQAGRRLVDGRLVAMSPFADAGRIVDLYGRADPSTAGLGRDFAAVQRTFNLMLRLQGYRGGRFDAYMRDSARHYGVPPDELLRRSSPAAYVADIDTPALVLHSRDDGLVPVSEAQALQEAARDNPNLAVWILPWGYHCLYEMADPDWYWAVLERVFRTPEPATPNGSPPTPRPSPFNPNPA
jgi:pimeloyl-ACP methyl ester carboxylesterase